MLSVTSMNPLISVVIPTYNRAYELARAIDSVLCQTYQNWEVLVVDNHSQDNTDELIRKYNDKRIKLYKIHNKGVIAASRNMGIKYAVGDFIAFLDSDDWWAPDKLSETVTCFSSGMDVVYHALFLVHKNKQRCLWRKTVSHAITHPVHKDLILNGNPLPNSSVVVRTKILRDIEGLSENADIIAMEDYDAWLRISKKTDKFCKLNKALGYYWVGGGNESNPLRTLKNMKAFNQLYSAEIEEYCSGTEPWWVSYNKGRAYYLLGEFTLAALSLKNINFGKSPLMVVFKSLWMKLIIIFFHRTNQNI